MRKPSNELRFVLTFVYILLLLVIFSPLAERGGLISRAHAASLDDTTCGELSGVSLPSQWIVLESPNVEIPEGMQGVAYCEGDDTTPSVCKFYALPDDQNGVITTQSLDCATVLLPSDNNEISTLVNTNAPGDGINTDPNNTPKENNDIADDNIDDVILPASNNAPLGTAKLPDRRVHPQPQRADVGLIITYYSDGFSSSCSAFAITDDAPTSTIATAAHCLQQLTKHYKYPHPGLIASRVEYYAGTDGNRYYQKCNSTSFSMNSAYEQLGENVQDDYGKIVLDCKLPANFTISLTTAAPGAGESIVSVGYPSDKETHTQWSSPGSLLSSTNKVTYTDNYTYPGQSGSPILNSSGEAFAITSAALPNKTFGIRITCGVEQFYLGTNASC